MESNYRDGPTGHNNYAQKFKFGFLLHLLLGNRIMFGNEDDLPPEKCQSLLDQYMAAEIKGRKISQQMFIKYEFITFNVQN